MGSTFTFDVCSRMRQDAAFKTDVVAKLTALDNLVKQQSAGKLDPKHLRDATGDLVKASGYNLGMLVPFYFPKYPRDEPLSLLTRPFMFSMFCLAPNSTIVLNAGRQVGKCASAHTRVTTSRGEMTMLELFESGERVE